MSDSSSSEQRGYLTPAEVGALLLVSPVTVRQWAQRGWLDAEVTAGGHRRFLRKEVERFARERGLTLHGAPHSRPRVLVVDDDPHFRGYLVEFLSGPPANLDVEWAQNGFEAGREVISFSPNAMVLDLMMPGMNGFNVCQHLKADPVTKSIKIIAITGYGTPQNVARILEAGADICLPKPVEEAQLLGALGIEVPAPKAGKPRKAGARS